jgi:hypothetical protein
MDHESFEPLGRWEVDRGSQLLSYDGWWHLGYDTMVTSEWGTPDTFENGLVSEILLGSKYGRRLHFWDLSRRKHLQEIDFGEEYQLVFELRPAHDPTKAYGFVNLNGSWAAVRQNARVLEHCPSKQTLCRRDCRPLECHFRKCGGPLHPALCLP